MAERAFVDGALRGDQEHLDLLYRRVAFVHRLARTVNRRLGFRLSDHEIDDVVQECHVTVCEKLRQYEAIAPFESWVASICEFAVRNAIRKKYRKPPVHLDLDDLEHAAADAALVRMLDLEQIERLLAGLSLLASVILRLHYLEGLTFEALAARLQILPSTAKSVHYRAIDQLRARLDAEDRGREPKAGTRRQDHTST